MSPAKEKQAVGFPVTDFSLPLVGGSGNRTLNNFLQGKRGAIVIFWSGICSHCLRYDEYLNSFAERHPEIGLVTIASRHGETPELIAKTVAERNLTFPILYDAGGAIAKQWYTHQTPRAFLVDKDGVLHYRGAINNFKAATDPDFADYLEPAVNQFLSGESIAKPETASFGCAIMSVYYILPKPI
jgi:peroxiredoxin